MSDSITIKGTVVRVGAAENIGKEFKKRSLRVKTGGKYPQTHDIEFVKDKMELVSGLSEGQTVEVECNLNGRLWEKGDKCFTSLSAWKLAVGEASSSDTNDSGDTSDPVDEEIPF